MAQITDPKIIAQLKKDLAEINRIYNKIGEKPLNLDFTNVNVDDIKLVRDYLSEAKTFVGDLDEGFSGMAESVRNIVGEWKKGFASPTQEATKSFGKLKSLAEKLSDDFKGVAELRGKEVKQINQQVKIEVERLKVLRAQLKNKKGLSDEEKIILANLESEYQVQQEILKGSEKRYQEEKKINKAMGLTGVAVKGIAGALEHIGIHAEFFEGVEDKMRKAAESGSKFKTAMAGARGVLSGIGEALADPVVQFTLVSKTVKGLVHLSSEFTKEVAKTGKMFGIAGHEAEHAYHTIEKASSMYYFPEELIEGQQKYNDALGMNLKFNQENAEVMQDLTERLGYSSEAAGNLVRISTALGKNFKTVDKNVTTTVNSFNKQNKTGVSLRKVMETIADASASTRFNIKGGEKGLAQAASIAAKYGKSMNEVADSAKSLLNFEDSISNELEAELFLGKDLNLERMRSAALTGDTKTQLEEQEKLVRKNFKNLKGNVLAQEAFAKSIGMSVEDVAKMAEQQDLMAKMSPKQLQQQQASQKAQAETAKKAEAMDRSLKAAAMEMKKALLPLVQAITPMFIQIAEAIGSVGKHLQGGTGKALLAVVGGIAAVKGVQKISSMFGGGGGGFMGLGGGDGKPGTGKQSLLSKVFGGGGKIGSNESNPMYVYVVNQGEGGGGGGSVMDSIGDVLGSRNTKGLNIFKKLSSAVGGKGTKVGRMTRNLAAMMGKRSSMGQQMMRSSKVGQSISNMAGKSNIMSKIAPHASKAGGFLGKAGKFLGKAAAPLTSVAMTGKGLYDFASDKRLRKTGAGGFMESLGGTGMHILDTLTFGATKALGNSVGWSIPGMSTDDVASARAIFHDSGRDPDDSRFPMSTDNKQLIHDILKNPKAYPSDIVSQAKGVNIKELAKGGIVSRATNAIVGEAGPEAVVPLNKFYDKIDELITVIKQGGNVYLDGTKVGTAMAVSSYKLQ